MDPSNTKAVLSGFPTDRNWRIQITVLRHSRSFSQKGDKINRLQGYIIQLFRHQTPYLE